MCGINGIFKKKEAVNERELRIMSSSVYHRGSDEAGFIISKDERIWLTNLRLSIRDIKNGQQHLYEQYIQTILIIVLIYHIIW